MPNLLIINPPDTPYNPKSFLIEPADIVTLVSCVRQRGFQADFLDMDAERLTVADLPACAYDFVLIVCDYHIPLHKNATIKNLFSIAGFYRQKKAFVCICGKQATFKPETFIFSDSPFACALLYEAEDTICQLMEGRQNVPGTAFLDTNRCLKTLPLQQRPDLTRFPLPDYRRIKLENYIDVRPLLSSRGCPNGCSFCHVPAFWGNWRAKTARQVVDEIEHLVVNTHAQKIIFLDDNALASPSRMEEICRLILNKKINVTLGCLGRVGNFSRNLAQLMYKAGFRWIHFGAESGSDRLLHQIGKKQTTGQIAAAVSDARYAGFRVRTSWIIDLPDTAEEDLQQTFSLIKQTLPDEIRLHYLSVRLGTAISCQQKEAAASQYIHNNRPVNHFTRMNDTEITDSVQAFLKELQNIGYLVLNGIEDYQKYRYIDWNDKNLKIVSLCPLRYGIGWTK